MSEWTIRAGRQWQMDDRLSFWAVIGWREVPVAEGDLRCYRWGYMVEFRLLPRPCKFRGIEILGRWRIVPVSWRWPFWITNLCEPEVLRYPVPEPDSRAWTGR